MDVDRNIQRRNLSFKLFVENSYCCSVTKLCLTLQFHGLQHTRIFSPPLSPGVCSDSCSLSRWCCLPISSSAVSFFFCLQSFPASGFPFQWVDSLHQVAKVLEFQLQHKSFQWIFRFISFRMDWFDLAVQGTLKSLLQHHNSKASILQRPVFFMVQLSHPYMATVKTVNFDYMDLYRERLTEVKLITWESSSKIKEIRVLIGI